MINRQYICGSSGTPDYLVIARNGPIVLGVKADASIKPGFLLLVGRFRACKDPQSDAPITATDLMQAFPDTPFSKIDSVRASSTFGIPIPVGGKKAKFVPMIESLINDFDKINTIYTAAITTLNIKPEINNKEVVEHLSEGWSVFTTKLGNYFNGVSEEAIGNQALAALSAITLNNPKEGNN